MPLLILKDHANSQQESIEDLPMEEISTTSLDELDDDSIGAAMWDRVKPLAPGQELPPWLGKHFNTYSENIK